MREYLVEYFPPVGYTGPTSLSGTLKDRVWANNRADAVSIFREQNPERCGMVKDAVPVDDYYVNY